MPLGEIREVFFFSAFYGSRTAQSSCWNCSFSRTNAPPYIVGYQTATLAQGESKAFAVQFDDVAEAGKKICVSNIFSSISGTLTGTVAWGPAMDQIWFWDKTGNEWKLYGFQKPKSKGAVGSWKRYIISETTFVAIDPETDVLTQGDSFLYVRNEAGELTGTLAGAVKPFTGSNAYTLEQGQSQYIAYPWPVEIKITDFNENKYLSAALTGTVAWGPAMDQIWLWDQTGNEWKLYGFQKPKSKGAVGSWKRYNISEGTWTEATDADVIAAGEGVLYVRNEAATLTINFAYDK